MSKDKNNSNDLYEGLTAGNESFKNFPPPKKKPPIPKNVKPPKDDIKS